MTLVIYPWDVFTFKGNTLMELYRRPGFLRYYFECCAKLGQPQGKPFTGKFMLRIPPDLHRKINIATKQSGENINAWTKEQLSLRTDHIF